MMVHHLCIGSHEAAAIEAFLISLPKKPEAVEYGEPMPAAQPVCPCQTGRSTMSGSQSRPARRQRLRGLMSLSWNDV